MSTTSGRERLLTREREQPLRQRGGAICTVDGALDEAVYADLSPAEPPLGKVQAAENHGQHIVEVVGNTSGQLPDGFHLLGLPQLLFGFHALGDFVGNTLLQSGIEGLEPGQELGVVDSGGGMAGNTKQGGLMLGLEFTRLGVTEEKSAEDFAGSRDHGDRQVGSDRKMALGHAFPRRVLAIAGVLQDVVGPHHARALEGRAKDGGVAGHREVFKRGSRHTGQRIQHVAAAIRRQNIVEKGAELSTRQSDAGIRHDLHDCLEVAFARDRSPGIIQYSEMTLGFLLRGDIQNRPDEPNGLAVGKDGLTGRGDPAFDPILDADGSVFHIVVCRRVRRQRCGHSLVGALPVLGMKALQERPFIADFGVRR